MPTPESEAQGRKLLTAVERLLADDETLLAKVEAAKIDVPRGDQDEDAWREQVAEKLIASHSTRSALAGGAAAVPAIVPGLGTLTTLVGGTLADVTLMLKLEVELALCLSALHGYDITTERERQIAFLMASVATYGVRAGRSRLVDLAAAEGTAVWNYTPRQISKSIVSVLTQIALLSISENFVRVVPFVGVAVGAGMNKVLTRRVGRRCQRELVLRRQLDAEATASRPSKGQAKASKGRTQKRAAKDAPKPNGVASKGRKKR